MNSSQHIYVFILAILFGLGLVFLSTWNITWISESGWRFRPRLSWILGIANVVADTAYLVFIYWFLGIPS